MSRVTQAVLDGFYQRLAGSGLIAESLAQSLEAELTSSPEITPADVLKLIEADSPDRVE